MVSFIHGLICIVVCSYLVLTTPAECGLILSQPEYMIMMMSAGYFTYDFFSMMYFGLLDVDMTVHHILCVLGLTVTIH